MNQVNIALGLVDILLYLSISIKLSREHIALPVKLDADIVLNR